jgi:predicted metallo-beta-lactamase superfamily hydrolase
MPGFGRKTFDLALKAREWKQVLRVLDATQKDQGFHLYCKAEVTEAVVATLLAIRQEMLQREAKEAGVEYKEEPLLVVHHALKVAIWNELTEEEREKWRKQAKKNNKERKREPLSADR